MQQEIIDLYDDYTHSRLDRRTFLKRLAQVAGSVAAAEALLPLLAANQAHAAILPADDSRVSASRITYPGADGKSEIKAYLARPAKSDAKKLPAVVVIHENRGLNAHIEDVTRRLALEGFLALAPDLLSPAGGTPADEDAAREAIGKLDAAAVTADLRATLKFLAKHETGNGKVGAVGFCWGGLRVNELAVAAGKDLSAGVAYYGRQPKAEDVPKIEAPLLLHYGGLDHQGQRRHSRLRSGARGRPQKIRDPCLRRRQPCLQQRHLGGALRQGGRRSRLVAHLGFFPPAPRIGAEWGLGPGLRRGDDQGDCAIFSTVGRSKGPRRTSAGRAPASRYLRQPPAFPCQGARPCGDPFVSASASFWPDSASFRPARRGLAFQLKLELSGLSNLVDITHAGDSRLFLVRQQGQILVWDGVAAPTVFLDISGLMGSGFEGGMKSIAFAPDYASTGFFFVHYSDTAQTSVLARYSRLTANTADPASAKILLTQAQTTTAHRGGQLAFDPEGMLMMALGDGGPQTDPDCHAQSSATYQGKLLRFDVHQNVNAAPFYGIPADNPFIGPGGFADEVWAYGLRNPGASASTAPRAPSTSPTSAR